MRHPEATPFSHVVELVERFPRCAGAACAEEGRFLCAVCLLAYCTREGCPCSEEHHRANIALSLLVPVAHDD